LDGVIGHELQVTLEGPKAGEVHGLRTAADRRQGPSVLDRQLKAQPGSGVRQDGRLHRRAELTEVLVRQSQTDTETAGLAESVSQVGG
jgi:hypothetical protein